MSTHCICGHPGPHPELLQGGKARLSAPYPRPLTVKIVEGFVAAFLSTGTFANKTAQDYCAAVLEGYDKQKLVRKTKKTTFTLFLDTSQRLLKEDPQE